MALLARGDCFLYEQTVILVTNNIEVIEMTNLLRYVQGTKISVGFRLTPTLNNDVAHMAETQGVTKTELIERYLIEGLERDRRNNDS